MKTIRKTFIAAPPLFLVRLLEANSADKVRCPAALG
jgi:hypothetical protein